MKKNDDVLMNRLSELCNLYELYAWKHEGSMFSVIVQDCSIFFYLYNYNGDIDMFRVEFDEAEGDLYEYISLSVLNDVLGNVRIHTDKNLFYNNFHKPYFKFFIYDDKILKLASSLVLKQDEQYIREGIEKMNYKFNFRTYDSNFLDSLDRKIAFVKKL